MGARHKSFEYGLIELIQKAAQCNLWIEAGKCPFGV